MRFLTPIELALIVPIRIAIMGQSFIESVADKSLADIGDRAGGNIECFADLLIGPMGTVRTGIGL